MFTCTQAHREANQIIKWSTDKFILYSVKSVSTSECWNLLRCCSAVGRRWAPDGWRPVAPIFTTTTKKSFCQVPTSHGTRTATISATASMQPIPSRHWKAGWLRSLTTEEIQSVSCIFFWWRNNLQNFNSPVFLGIWLHVEGANTPAFDSSGFVTGPDSTGTMIDDMRSYLDFAQSKNILVIFVLWNGAYLREQHTIDLFWDEAKLQSYIDKALKVKSLTCKTIP